MRDTRRRVQAAYCFLHSHLYHVFDYNIVEKRRNDTPAAKCGNNITLSTLPPIWF